MHDDRARLESPDPAHRSRPIGPRLPPTPCFQPSAPPPAPHLRILLSALVPLPLPPHTRQLITPTTRTMKKFHNRGHRRNITKARRHTTKKKKQARLVDRRPIGSWYSMTSWDSLHPEIRASIVRRQAREEKARLAANAAAIAARVSRAARATHVDGVLGLGPNAAGDADAASLAAAAEPTSSDHVGVPVRAAANQNVGGDKNGSGGGGGDR